MLERKREIEQLIAALTDGELSETEFHRLDALLEGDSEARAAYLKQLQVHTLLLFEGAPAAPPVDLPDSAEAFLQYVKEASRLGAPTSGSETATEGRAVLATSLRQSFFGGRIVPGLFPAFAVLLIAFLAVYARLPSQNLPQSSSHEMQSKDQAELKSSASNSPAMQTSPSRLRLDSGTASLQIANVGHVTVNGPADFELISPMRARLHSGRLRMRVTEKTGHGFVVETPDGEITDLGTEFGVDVTSGKNSALAVFEGAVDLRIADLTNKATHAERLLGGDGALFSLGGQLNRLNSIMTGEGAKFAVCGEESSISFDNPIIVDVYDSLPSGTTKRYYEIVPRGMGEDALAYVDRVDHNWNGFSKAWGMPRFLRGGDYVKTFCDDKGRTKQFELTVVLSKPANLYVLTDRRLTAPDWLTASFERSKYYIGMDTGRKTLENIPDGKGRYEVGSGPGDSVDLEFEIWKRSVEKAGTIKLGPNGKVWREKDRNMANMYAIVAVELPPNAKAAKKSPHKSNAKDSTVSLKRSK